MQDSPQMNLGQQMQAAGIKPDNAPASSPQAPNAPVGVAGNTGAGNLGQQMQAAGVKPDSTPIESVEDKAASGGALGAVTAFNAGVQGAQVKAAQNIMSGAAQVTAFNQALSQGFQNISNRLQGVGDDLKSQYQSVTQAHPTASSAGGFVGISSDMLPLAPAVAAVPAAIAGGLLGAAEANPGERTLHGVISGATAGIGAAVGNYLSSVLKGAAIQPTATAENIAAGALKQANVDPTVTAQDFMNTVNDLKTTVKTQDQANYEALQGIGNNSGIMVDRAPVAATLIKTQALANVTGSPSVTAAIDTMQQALADGRPIPINGAFEMSKNLGQAAIQAGKQSDTAQQAILLQAKNALDKSISTSAAGTPFEAAWNVAKTYHAQAVAPLTTTVASTKLLDRFASQKYLNTVVNNVGDNGVQSFQKAYTQLPAQAQAQLLSAHINALQQGATSAGGLNLTKFANSWSQSALQNPALMGANAQNMQNIAKGVKALGEAMGHADSTGLGEATGQGVAGALIKEKIAEGEFGQAGKIALSNMLGLDKMSMLHGLGQAAADPATQALLKVIQTLPNASPILPRLGQRVVQAVGSAASTLPARLGPTVLAQQYGQGGQ